MAKPKAQTSAKPRSGTKTRVKRAKSIHHNTRAKSKQAAVVAAEPGPPLGKAYRGQFSRRQANGDKLFLRPILAGIFAVGQACNPAIR